MAPRRYAVVRLGRVAVADGNTIVGVAAVLLGATAKLMGDTVRVIEIVSYGLIVLLGARLLWVKGHGFIAALRELEGCAGKRRRQHQSAQLRALRSRT